MKYYRCFDANAVHVCAVTSVIVHCAFVLSVSKIVKDDVGSQGMELTSQGAGTYW